MKKCNKCKEIKALCEFPKRSDSKDGYRNDCKKCIKEYRLNYNVMAAKEIIPIGMKKCTKCLKLLPLNDFGKCNDGLRSRCKNCHNEDNKKYRTKVIKIEDERLNGLVGKERAKVRHQIWYRENKDHVIAKKAARRKNINVRMSENLRNRLNMAIKRNSKIGSAVKDLGCSIEYLKSHLEQYFYSRPKTNEKMTWENYGISGWHIDHIIPLSSFDLTDRKDMLLACHYTNLQPLWAEDNLKKGSKSPKN